MSNTRIGSTYIGNGATASNFNAIAMGSSTIASGTISTAIGDNTTASGSSSTAMGNRTIASESHATAMGFFTIAEGRESTAMGNNTIASSQGELALGKFNTSGTNRLLTVGNGSNHSNRSDAMVILNDGKVGIGTSNPTESLEVIGNVKADSLSGDGSQLTGITSTTNIVIDADLSLIHISEPTRPY